MQFSDITKAIHDAWTFSWPPLVMCLIVFLVSRHLNPEGTRQAIEEITSSIKTYGAQLDSARSLLEPYGLTKLIPVISAVAVIGFLYVLNGPVTMLAAKLPPHLSYSPDVLLSRSMSNDEKLVLLRKHPTANSFNAAYYMALQKRKIDNAAPLWNRVDLNYKVDNLIKFSLLIVFLLSILSVRNGMPVGSQVGKTTFLVIFLACLWCINLVSLLRNQEGQFFDEWATARVQVLEDADSFLQKEKTEREKLILEQLERDRNSRWWRVYLIDPYSITWFKRTFLLQDG